MSDTLAQGAALMQVIISTWTRSRYVKVRSGRIGACERPPPGPVTASASRQNVNPYRDATFLAMDDFLFAALFLCMTPLLTALSSLVDATLSASAAAEASPESAAVLNLRIQVRSSLLTASVSYTHLRAHETR